MYAKLLKENRETQKIVKELIVEVEDLREEILVLNGNKKKKGRPKQKISRPSAQRIKPIWEREGFKNKKDWQKAVKK